MAKNLKELTNCPLNWRGVVEGRVKATFTDWLRRQIDAYLAEKEPKPKRRKGKGG